VGSWTFAAGTHAVTSRSDDGSQVYFDKRLVLDAWQKSVSTYKAYAKITTKGMHDVLFLWEETTRNAYGKLGWKCANYQNQPDQKCLKAPAPKAHCKKVYLGPHAGWVDLFQWVDLFHDRVQACRQAGLV